MGLCPAPRVAWPQWSGMSPESARRELHIEAEAVRMLADRLDGACDGRPEGVIHLHDLLRSGVV